MLQFEEFHDFSGQICMWYVNLPEIGDLVFQKNSQSFFNILEFLLFFVGNASNAVRSKVITVVMD